MTYDRYLLACLAALSIVGAAIAAFNWAVDPVGVFGNSPNGIYVFSERPYKIRQVQNFPHDVLLLGSSKPAAFDPASVGEHRIYNASLAFAVPEEILEILERGGQRADAVLIGLDFYMFNGKPSTLKTDLFPSTDSIAGLPRFLFSLPIFLDSVRHLYLTAVGRPVLIKPNGQWNRWDRDLLEQVPWSLGDRRQAVLEQLRTVEYDNFSFAARRLDVLRNIRDLLGERGQDYRVFINPLDVCVLGIINASPSRADFDRFRREVKAVFPEAQDYSVSSYSVSENFYRFDPFHYKTDVATRLIRDVLAGRRPEPLNDLTVTC